MRLARTPLVAIAFTCAALLAGCVAGQGGKSGAAAEASLQLPSDLVLMPIGDERPERFEDVEFPRYVREAAIRVLTKRGYQVVTRDEIAHEGLAATRGYDEMSGADLAALGPGGGGGLLFLTITRADHTYTYGGEDYSVTLTGLIVTPDNRAIVWRDSGSGRTSLGGFFRIFSPRAPSYDAIYQALQRLLHDVPKRTT